MLPGTRSQFGQEPRRRAGEDGVPRQQSTITSLASFEQAISGGSISHHQQWHPHGISGHVPERFLAPASAFECIEHAHACLDARPARQVVWQDNENTTHRI